MTIQLKATRPSYMTIALLTKVGSDERLLRKTFCRPAWYFEVFPCLGSVWINTCMLFNVFHHSKNMLDQPQPGNFLIIVCQIFTEVLDKVSFIVRICYCESISVPIWKCIYSVIKSFCCTHNDQSCLILTWYRIYWKFNFVVGHLLTETNVIELCQEVGKQ